MLLCVVAAVEGVEYNIVPGRTRQENNEAEFVKQVTDDNSMEIQIGNNEFAYEDVNIYTLKLRANVSSASLS